MTVVAAIAQGGDELGSAFRQDNVALQRHRVATKVHRFLRCNWKQIRDMFSNCVLAVLVKCRREPNDGTIREWTETSVEMIETWIDKFNGDDQTSEHLRDRAMRFDVRAEFVTAKKCFAAEKSVTFTFEIVIILQPRYLVAAFLHPTGKMRRLARAFFVPEIAWDK